MIEGSFTVTFETPYWVGIFERIDEQGYAAAKIIFGAEPNAETVRLAVLREYRGLRFSAPVATRPEPEHEVNYKRRQREVQRLVAEQSGPTAEASAALAEEHQRQAQERKKQARAEREAEEAHKLQVHLERKKAKKKGH